MPGAEDSDMDLALAAIRRGGEIALSYFRKGPRWHRKPDNTPVCEADLAVDEALRTMLLQARPDYGWLSEETRDDAARLHKKRVWVLDPVDGTRSYLSGEATWCISLALVEDGKPVIGLIWAPALDRLWQAKAGGGAFENGRAIHVSSRETLKSARLIAPAFVHDPTRWQTPWPEDVFTMRLPSLALRLAFVASAEVDGMFAPGRKSEWDLAAGDLIVREAGGVISDARGRPIVYNREDPHPFGVVAANPTLHEKIVQRLAGLKPPARHGKRKTHATEKKRPS